MNKEPDFRNSKYYVNRELSWLNFMERVLAEAESDENPLMERIRFLGITSRSVDEFFAVRVATLLCVQRNTPGLPDISGLTPKKQLSLINECAERLMERRYACYDMLCEALKKENISRVIDKESLEKALKGELHDTVMSTIRKFQKRVKPLDPAKIKSESVYITLKTEGAVPGEPEHYFFEVREGERVFFLPAEKGALRFFLIEDLIKLFPELILPKVVTKSVSVFSAVRDRDGMAEGRPTPIKVQKWLKTVEKNPFVRVVFSDDTDLSIRNYLFEKLNLSESFVYSAKGPLNLSFLSEIAKRVSDDKLFFPKLSHGHELDSFKGKAFFSKLEKRDLLVIHPYESFDVVLKFLEAAVRDKNVTEIFQTFYRVSDDSKIIDLLAEASKLGKRVTVLFELRARFDESRNIKYSKLLKDAGVKVVYGKRDFKAHCKFLIVKREIDGKTKTYAHLSTGNYNESTARSYTDIGLFTADPDICADAIKIFDYFLGKRSIKGLKKLAVSPFELKAEFIRLIEREVAYAREGKNASISAKVNSLCDSEIIEALYRAGLVGVKIKLIVRGICCLKPEIPELKGNISVYSAVGDFLEHSRIYVFGNNGNPEYFCSSADWMQRNLERRVEVMFPVTDKSAREKLDLILDTLSGPGKNISRLVKGNEYEKTIENGGEPVNLKLWRAFNGGI